MSNTNKNSKLLYKPEYLFIQEPALLNKALPDIYGSSILYVDTETTGLDPFTSKLLLLQISTSKSCYIVDCTSVDITPLKSVLEDMSVVKVLHNAKFDYKILASLANIKLKNVFCTYIAERILTTGIMPRPGLSLKAVAQKYLGMVLDKSVRTNFISGVRLEFTKEELEYAALDSIVLGPIYETQVGELIDSDLLKTAALEFKVLPVIADMELAGCLINSDAWLKIVKDVRSDRDAVSERILKQLSPGIEQNSLFGLPVLNLSSPSQLVSCFSKLGIRDKIGKPLVDTNEDTLVELADEYNVISDILLYRELDKIVTSYGLSFIEKIHSVTGRIHADINQIKADTGRTSNSNPNLQQIPGKVDDIEVEQRLQPIEGLLVVHLDPKDNKFKVRSKNTDFRSCFVASRGYKIVGADYSQQEIRVLADASGDPAFGQAYMNNEDVHTKTASDVFEVPVDKVTKNQRKVAKVLNFALVYGAREWKIAKTLNISEEEAAGVIKKYFKVYGGINSFLSDLSSFAIKNGFSYTITGRRRYYSIPSPTDLNYKKEISRVKRQAPNHFVQGSSADVTKQALIYVSDFIQKEQLDAKILMAVHDEIVAEVHESQAEVMARALEKCMIDAFSTYFKKIPMVVDAVISDCWTKG